VEFNNAFFEKLGQSPEVVALVTNITHDVAEIARKSAPVGETGDYKDGIEEEVFVHKQRRAVGWVKGTDRKTLLVEAKTGNLARAIRTAARQRRGG
jgi:hypothetical protein